MDSLKPQLPKISKEDRTPLVDVLLELLAWQQIQIDKLEQEILKLKGETTKPKIKPSKMSGSRYFCESFYGHPCPTSGKNYATAYAFGGPSRPASLVAYPTRGMQHRYRNDSTRFRKACIFTTHKALRENTCPIASGDYSTPVSQRTRTRPKAV